MFVPHRQIGQQRNDLILVKAHGAQLAWSATSLALQRIDPMFDAAHAKLKDGHANEQRRSYDAADERYLANIPFYPSRAATDRKGDCITSAPNPILWHG